MNQRTARLLAASLTAFVLVILGGIAARGTAKNDGGVTAASAQPSVDPSTNSVLQEREVAYRQTIEQANAQLAEANRRLREAAGTLLQSAPASTATETTYPVSAEQAGRRALEVAPGAILTRIPEVVDYQGTTAYEVVLDHGTSYVDARSGAVLFNGAARNNTLRGEPEHDDDERYEGDERDGDRD